MSNLIQYICDSCGIKSELVEHWPPGWKFLDIPYDTSETTGKTSRLWGHTKHVHICPGCHQKLKIFFSQVDWDKLESNNSYKS